MEQRRLRLGDILDDYCPRERRVTNHAVVAMIDEDVKQTRCTTCDAEHVYKGGKAPRRRKGEPAAQPVPGTTMTAHEESDNGHHAANVDEPIAAGAIVEPPIAEPEVEPEPEVTDEGPVHRPLIRATLPRPEGIKTERPAPDFTIRQNNGRGNGNFRGRGAQAQGGNGGRPGGGGGRFSRGPQQGQGQGRGQGRGANQGFGRSAGAGQRHGGGPKKRSR
jgi:uncharacterized membrane protein YgcG